MAPERRPRFGVVVDEALEIERAQPFQRKRRAGDVTQQALTPRLASGLDAPGRVHGEAAAAFPLRHRSRVIARPQAASHEDAR